MAKMKFDQDKLDEVTGSAALQAKKSEGKFKDVLIRKIPQDTYDKIKEQGFTFSGYAKAAIQEKMKRDGIN